MKGDISRSTFDRKKHYTGVRMQQGRVLLDAEWNEQGDVAAYLDETVNTDVIGVSGASRISGGFQLLTVPGDLIITPGRMWVDGILCEADAGDWSDAAIDGTDGAKLTAWPADASRYVAGLWLQVDGLNAGNPATGYGRITSINPNTRVVRFTNPLAPLTSVTRVRPVYSYATQPHDPEPAETTLAAGVRSLTIGADFVAFLDVWSRHLTAVEDDAMREIALGGPDTTTRTQTIWQVRLDKTIQKCADVVSPVSQARMAAQTAPVAQPPNPCIVPSQAGYRGLANQLYRVEVHKGGNSGVATFKWSRDNAAFVFPVDGPIAAQATQLRLGSLGRDDRFGLKANDWVELIDERLELQGLPGFFARVHKTPEQNNRILELDAATLPAGTDFNDPTKSRIDMTRRPRVRLWSYDPDTAPVTGDTTLTTGGALPLESGIEVVFSGTAFRSGEYWQIPARTAINEETGDIEWPRFGNAAIPQAPRGITHHHAALADVTVGGSWTVEDCRPLFSPLTAPELFYLSGDGQEVMPDLVTDARVTLPFPLKVGVSNGGPIANAKVEFKITAGDGRLQNAQKTFEVITGADGIASTTWDLDAATPHQLCQAKLLKGNGYDPVNLPPIEFNASISVASQVAYDPDNCAELKARGAKTVQKALDVFCDILDDPKLYFVGGDGQETLRKGTGPSELPMTIDVGVADGIRPLGGQKVRFTASDGGQINNTAGPVDVTTAGVTGLASVTWQLNSGGPDSQTATARLIVNNVPTGLPVIFKASFREEGSGVCTIQLSPGAGWEAPLLALTPGQDAEICFKVGEFKLEQPVLITGAGSLKFTGGGPGTRIIAEKHETALRFEDCDEVIVRDLSAEAKVAGVQDDQKHLGGVLSFHGCGTVVLEALAVQCASALDRQTTCITIQSSLFNQFKAVPAQPAGSGTITGKVRRVLGERPLTAKLLKRAGRLRGILDGIRGIPKRKPGAEGPIIVEAIPLFRTTTIVRITDCELTVGHGQVGVLAVNPLIAWIENNVINAIDEEIPLPILLGHARARVPWRRLVFGYPRVQQSDAPPAQSPRNFLVQLHDAQGKPLYVAMRTREELQEDWHVFARTPLPPTVKTNGQVIDHLRNFVRDLMLDAAQRAKFPAFESWFSDLKTSVPAQAATAIIVAGTRPGEVQINGNVISGAAEGIRVAASEQAEKIPGFVERAVIRGNSISIPQYDELRARHGIHAANCNSLLIEDNIVTRVQYVQERLRVEGIQVIGDNFGPMLGVQANHVRDCDLVVVPHTYSQFETYQWYATDNMTERGTNTISNKVRVDPPNAAFSF